MFFHPYPNMQLTWNSRLLNTDSSLTDRYLKNFVTPYFIFVRDTLSYLALLGLHFVICLAPSQIPFSGVEWAIFVFFMGRMAMEGKQLIRTSMIRGHKGSVVLWELNTYFR